MVWITIIITYSPHAGYGSLAPSTGNGQIFFIFFSLLIPLNLLILLQIGSIIDAWILRLIRKCNKNAFDFSTSFVTQLYVGLRHEFWGDFLCHWRLELHTKYILCRCNHNNCRVRWLYTRSKCQEYLASWILPVLCLYLDIHWHGISCKTSRNIIMMSE